MRSFPRAFVQLGLLHVQRVLEQGLGSGFELYRPVPHGEQVQRRAGRIPAFPALPKSTGQAAPGRRGGAGGGGGQGGADPGGGRGKAPAGTSTHAPRFPGSCSRLWVGEGRGHVPVTVLALPQPPVKSIIFAILHLRKRRLRRLSACLRSRSWGGRAVPTSPWDLAKPSWRAGWREPRAAEGCQSYTPRHGSDTREAQASLPGAARSPFPTGAPHIARVGDGSVWPCHEGRRLLWFTPSCSVCSRSVLLCDEASDGSSLRPLGDHRDSPGAGVPPTPSRHSAQLALSCESAVSSRDRSSHGA